VLLLFDIDGTLLQGAHVLHRDALHAALREVYGVADPAAHRVAAAGRTDTAIAREIVGLCGVADAAFDERLEAFQAACCDAHARACPPSTAELVAPGMAELLEDLARRGDVLVSLLTGNYELIARLKLERAGIGRHFPAGQGAFGSDAESRSELPAIARARAGTNGTPYPRERTIVIGDTPLDIACARADGVRAFAIANGPYGSDELAEADAVAGDADELGRLLRRELDASL
jgi:phosphoglycolate phosphatase-like HAD superfamily hydrolase